MVNYFNLQKFANQQPWQMTKAEFLNREKDIRSIVDSSKDFSKFKDEKLANIDWQPLYKFLERVGDEEHKWANGFMWMGEYDSILLQNTSDDFKISQIIESELEYRTRGGRLPIEIPVVPITMFQYKHGITRKTLTIDGNADVYDVVKNPYGGRVELRKYPFGKAVKLVGVSDEYVQNTYNLYKKWPTAEWWQYKAEEEATRIFHDIDTGFFSKVTPTVTRETSYNDEYIKKSDEELIRAGYKVLRSGNAGMEVQNPATTHYREVEKALAEGLPVSDDVLLDYPDLKQKFRP